MKKILLTVAALGVLSGTALADSSVFIAKDPAAPGKNLRQVKRMVDEADNENEPEDGFLVFGYCEGLYTGIGTGNANQILQAAIEIPASTASEWTGNKLTGVRIGFGESSQYEITVFLTEKLGATPFYTQTARMQENGAWNDVVLETPYEIAGKGFFVGYSIVTKTANDFPIGVDYVPTNNTMADNIAIGNQWDHIGTGYGSMCIQAVIEGDNLPQNDVAILGYDVPEIVVLGEPFETGLYVTNRGSNNISSLDFYVTVDDASFSGLDYTMNPPVIGPGQYAEVVVSGASSSVEGAAVPMTVSIDKVNGNDDYNPSDNAFYTTLVSLEEGYERNVVVEEWTGTWCGWCPRGIVGMEYMEEKYGEKGFIGIAVHGNDEMAVSSYNSFLNKYSGGAFPGCIMERNPNYSFDPNKDDLEYYFNYLIGLPTYGKVELNADFDWEKPDEITVSADATFAMNLPSSKYRFAFVITENGMGPYRQTNYFAKSQNTGQKLEWWDEQGTAVYYEFDHVARLIKNALGIANSLPANIVKGETYSYETTLSTSAVGDITKCEVIALLLDYTTGQIVNAAKIKMTETSDVKGVVAEAAIDIRTIPGAVVVEGECSDIAVYSVDGMAVATASAPSVINLPKGIYIVKASAAGGSSVARKVAVN